MWNPLLHKTPIESIYNSKINSNFVFNNKRWLVHLVHRDNFEKLNYFDSAIVVEGMREGVMLNKMFQVFVYHDKSFLIDEKEFQLRKFDYLHSLTFPLTQAQGELLLKNIAADAEEYKNQYPKPGLYTSCPKQDLATFIPKADVKTSYDWAREKILNILPEQTKIPATMAQFLQQAASNSKIETLKSYLPSFR